MRKPNFLIVGAAKSGTTSLFEYLRGHPDVFMPDLKEASYFAGGGTLTEADYFGLFREAGAAQAVGEASTAYLYVPKTATTIRRTLGPSTRIIIILRNPVDMAYSLWGHMVREGGEDLGFFDALKAERARMADPEFHRQAKNWPFNFAYASRARYSAQVAAYLRAFGPSQVKVLIFEEFFADVAAGFAELCRFLEVTPEYRPVFRAFNRSSVLRSSLLRRILVEPAPWKQFVGAVTPDGPRARAKAWLLKYNTKEQRLPLLRVAEREHLWRLLAPDVAELEAVLGRRLDCWGAQRSTVSLAEGGASG